MSSKRIQKIKDAKNAKKIFKSLPKTKFSPSNFKIGKMILFKYNAKDKSMKYDRLPCIIILNRNKYHTLGINFHWAPLNYRISLIEYILKLNEKNIKNNKPLEVSYDELKKFIKKTKGYPIIRKYINLRISKSGIIVPDNLMLPAVKYSNTDFALPSPYTLLKIRKQGKIK